MQTDEFFAYLKRNPATRHLADELSGTLELRAELRRRVAAQHATPHAA
jgi:hypothetical protein